MAEMAIPPRTGKYPQHPCVAATIQFEAQTNNYQQRSVPNHRPCAQTLPHTHTSKEQIDKIAEETDRRCTIARWDFAVARYTR